MLDDAVPQAAPTEATWRVSWDVVEEILDDARAQVTVKIRGSLQLGLLTADESDGIPSEVDQDVSIKLNRTVSVPVVLEAYSSTDITIDNYTLTAVEKEYVLNKLVELGDRHGMVSTMERPFALCRDNNDFPDTVKFLVLRWKTWKKWLLSLDRFEFAEMRTLLTITDRDGNPIPHRIREGGLQFLQCLTEVVTNMEAYDDVPSLLLEF